MIKSQVPKSWLTDKEICIYCNNPITKDDIRRMNKFNENHCDSKDTENNTENNTENDTEDNHYGL